MTKKVLVVGSNGMLGSDIVQVFRESGFEVIASTRKDFDITKQNEVQDFFSKNEFECVINCAAYTKVDDAEKNSEEAFLINETGAKNIAVEANKKGASVVYISTDYVFDGEKGSPYNVDDKPNPINVYGASKLAGEIATAKFNPKHYIVRTSWLYGKNGKNFVKTMIELSKTQKEIKVVNDQFGCPTNTLELSDMIRDLLINYRDYGIYHCCGNEIMTWFDFAKRIFNDQGIIVDVIPVHTEKFSRPAKRPRNSAMNRNENY